MSRLTIVLTTLACAAAFVVAAPSAGASTVPHVHLEPVQGISAGGTASFHYTGSHLRSGTRVGLQSLTGKGKGSWHTVATSSKLHGTVKGTLRTKSPGKPGTLTLRVAALRHGHAYAVSARRTVHAYGWVSLAALCKGVLHASVTAHGNSCSSGSADTGKGKTFHYVMITSESTPEQGYQPQFGATGTSCRSISVTFVSDDGGPEVLILRQQKAKQQKHTTSGNGVGSFAATLNGSTFGVSVAEEDNDLFTDFNGSASCYTANGAR